MKYFLVMISENIEFDESKPKNYQPKDFQVGEYKEGFQKKDLEKKLEELNGKGRQKWELVEGISEQVLKILSEQAESNRRVRKQEREDIDDYFREAKNAIESLQEIWKQKF